MNEFEITELYKCMKDIEYFADRYIKVQHPVKGIIGITLNDFQRKVIKKYQTTNSFFECGPRQVGKSTVAGIILLHQSLFNDDRSSAMISDKNSRSIELLDRIRFMYSELPRFMQVRITANNQTVIRFENGCELIADNIYGYCFRGRNISNVYVDESEFIPFVELQRFVYNIKPHVAAGSRLFALSSVHSSELFDIK